ncbi:hypothetical protein H2199_006669 [Coniosporium tulheliwenetii]|uniref:Uncharacterized protein n=1 Tax=Coniosporium tulheliwenetii TaxID=3383036 RepID=A0ACC2YU80_9PEZI|nr:hypothetical protein H2199_006669 [Cladosporium sp. JES 115]
MPVVEVNGVRKKVACTSEADSLNETAPSPTTPPNRVQKSRHKKSISTRSPGTLEKALRASEDAERAASNVDTVSPAGEILDETKKRLDSGVLPQTSNGPISDVVDALPERESQDTNFPPQPSTTYTEQQPAEVPTSSLSGSCCSSRPKVVKATTEPIQIHQTHTTELFHAAQQQPTKIPFGATENGQPTKRSCCSNVKAVAQTDTFTQLSPTEPKSYTGHDLSHAQASSMGTAYPSANGHNGVLGQNQQFSYANNVQAASYVTSAPFALDASAFAPIIYQHHQSSVMPHLPLSTFDGGLNNGLLHNCTCGDACACLGCAAHPRNDTTINYIRQMADFMMHQSPAQTPYMMEQPPYLLQSPLQQHFGGTTPQIMPYVPLGAPFYTSHAPNLPTYGHVPNGSAVQPPQAAPPTSHPQFDLIQPQPQRQTYANPLYPAQPATTASVPDAPRAGHATPPVHPITNSSNQESPATPEKEAFSNTILSPTSFFFNELVLGCSDATGLCQCGDGCTCVGCLTHGGHNGVPLESPSAFEGAEGLRGLPGK